MTLIRKETSMRPPWSQTQDPESTGTSLMRGARQTLSKAKIMCAAAVGLFSQIHGVDAATCNADLLAAGVVWQNGGNCEVVPADSSSDGTSLTGCGPNKYSLEGSSTCEDCPAGFECSSTEPQLVNFQSGQYSANGDESQNNISKPSNQVTNGISVTTCSNSGDEVIFDDYPWICHDCPKGYKCDTNPPNFDLTTTYECADGYYQTTGGACQECTLGQYCPSKTATGVSCPTGTYAAAGSLLCTSCPKDSGCTSSAASGCGAQEYSPLGDDTCHSCPAGYDCDTSNGSNARWGGFAIVANNDQPMPCGPGYYNDGSTKQCQACPAGSECSASAITGTCPGGSYNAGGTPCLQCPPGSACSGGTKSTCSSPQWSIEGQTTCSGYDEGTHATSETKQKPQDCPSGMYTVGIGSNECTECLENNSCDGTNMTPCGSGVSCPPGTSSGNASGSCQDWQDCNTYTNNCAYGEKLNASGSCVTCAKDEACPLRGATPVSVTAGWYSPANENQQFICPGGKDCTNADSITDCDDGWYSPEGTNECLECKAPYACPNKELGTLQQIDCAMTRGYYQIADGQTTCQICDAGQFCEYKSAQVGKGNLVQFQVNQEACPAGTYSLPGMEFCYNCPPGYECPSTSLPAMNYCLTGTYSMGGQNACTVCPEDYECVGTQKIACDANKWSSRGEGICHFFDAGYSGYAGTPHSGSGIAQFAECSDGYFSLYGTIDCKICPKGHYCPSKKLMPKMCEPGKFQATTGAGSGGCTGTCPAGKYSMFGAEYCTDCPAGFQCDGRDQVPKKCPARTYAVKGATTCSNCAQGSMCHSGATTSSQADSKCPAGIYCSSPTQPKTQSLAVAGRYCPDRGFHQNSQCSWCTLGYYCPQGSSEEFYCPPGHFCIARSTAPDACSAGTYNPEWGATSSGACDPCPTGYYCPAGTKSPIKCPAGYVCTSGSTSGTSTTCGAGQYSGAEALGSTGECRECPKGHYCPTGAVFPTACPAGKYNPNISQVFDGACFNCPRGRVCPYLGNQSGDDISLPCLPGYPCPEGTATFYDVKCAAGTFMDLTIDQYQISQCSPCPAGYACSEGCNTLTNPPVKCTAGYFCPQSSISTTTNPCPAGTWSDRTDLIIGSQCYDCPPGKYCAGGETEPTGDCHPGSYCPGKSVITKKTGLCQCTYDSLVTPTCTCPAAVIALGNSCSDGDMGEMDCDIETTGITCEAGTYLNRNSAKAASECKICPLGSYCPAEMACTVGSTCASAGQTATCPLGATCYYGTQFYEACPIGTYGKIDKLSDTSSANGASRYCETCPAGYKCETTGMTVPTPCGKGFYSAAGTSASTCTPCPVGQFCERDDTTDTMAVHADNACEAGYECPEGTDERPFYDHENQQVNDKYSCATGYYCQGGVAIACLAGTYNPLYGADALAKCFDVPAGFYTDADGQSDFVDNLCPKGHFCPQASNDPIANVCPGGTFRRTLQATEESDCSACPSGYYCPEQSWEPKSCPQGYYCQVGQEFPLPCPIGTFGAGLRLTDVSDCTTCYGGRFCSQYGLIEPDGVCDPGFYCVDKSMTPVPKTLFVRGVGNICEAGGFCPIATKYPLPCLPGFYNDLTARTAAADCKPCDCGMFCDGRVDATRTDIVDALAYLVDKLPAPSMSGPCDDGYWCNYIDYQDGNINDVSTYATYPYGGGSSHARQHIATMGHFASQNGAQTIGACSQSECNKGTYQWEAGKAMCINCKERYYCPNKAMTYPEDCPAGKYCDVERIGRWADPDPRNCPTGTFSNRKNLIAASECQDCVSGKWCNSEALTDVEGDCSAGYFCLKKSTQAAPGTLTSQFGPCPVFTYCDVTGETGGSSTGDAGGVGFGSPCQPGTYENVGQKSSLEDCSLTPKKKYSVEVVFPAGTEHIPTMTKKQCAEGYYCPQSTTVAEALTMNSWPTSSTYFCPKGYMCTANSYQTTVCPDGTFQFNPIQGDCLECPPGYYCNVADATANESNSLPTIDSTVFIAKYKCPTGHWCEAGTTTWKQNPCPPGTYNKNKGAKTRSECIPAPPGYYIALQGQSALSSTDKCNAGYYCMLGSYTPMPTGASVATHLGYNLIYQNVGGDCDDGYYCPEGTPIMIPCTPGYICNKIANGGSPVELPTLKCTDKYYCIARTTNAIGGSGIQPEVLCPDGYYCGDGAAEPIPCPAGTYHDINNSSFRNLKAKSECTACTANYYCPDIAATSVDTTNHKCEAGFTCEAGSTHKRFTICPQGFKCPVNQATAQACVATDGYYQDQKGADTCLTCQPGFSCTNTAATRCEPQNEGPSFYCPGGAASIANSEKSQSIACPAGKYSYQDRARQLSDCLDCPPGYYCKLVPDSSLKKMEPCPAGYYCMGGISDTDQLPNSRYSYTNFQCPIGFYCPEGTNAPIPCDPGSYCATTQLSSVTAQCDEGYYCDYITRSSTDFDGFQSSSPTYSGLNFCMNQDSSTCIQGNTVANPVQCPRGHYCPIGSQQPYPCPIGTYNPDLQKTIVDDCQSCEIGMYCPNAGQTVSDQYCEAGYYCEFDKNNDMFSNPCEAGHMCQPGLNVGTNGKVECPEGTYQPNDIQSTCYACPEGYYCPDKKMTEPTICPVGYYCGANAQATLPCPAGTFSDLEGLTQATDCQLGAYGKYYPSSGAPFISATSGTNCDALYKCNPDISNPSAVGITTATPTSCAENEICPAGTSVPDLCEPGKYLNPQHPAAYDPTTLGPVASTLCSSCPVDYYCPLYGMVGDSTNVASVIDIKYKYTQYKCLPGYKCLGGAIHPSKRDGISVALCDIGSFCDPSIGEQTTSQKCPVNYYTDVEGQSECFPCPAGYTCYDKGTQVPTSCERGKYCISPTMSFADAVVDDLNNVTPFEVAIDCDAGSYNSALNATSQDSCLSCPPGKYCLQGQQTFTGLCKAGFVCTGGQAGPEPTGVFDFFDYADIKSGPCPAGYKCPTGSSYPIPCEAGTYNDDTGGTECKECPEYKYCDRIGLQAPTGPCQRGYVCHGGATFAQPNDYVTGQPCDKGHFCTGGQQFECPGGYYAPVLGMGDCDICPPGSYCGTKTTTPLDCDTYSYCPQKTTTPIVCPDGTYTNPEQIGLEEEEQCSACPTGYYCTDGKWDRGKTCAAGYYCWSGAAKANDEDMLCPSGFFCAAGTKLPTACEEGKTSKPGSSTSGDCTDCEAGYYCVIGVGSVQENECPTGHYCPAGNNDPIECPKGTYNSNTKSEGEDACKTCPPGTNCDRGGIAEYANHQCPPGHYCPDNTYQKKKCPAGTFRPTQGAWNAGPDNKGKDYSRRNEPDQACYKCPAGFYCPNLGTTIPKLCEPGKYCEQGVQFSKACEPGFYCIAGSGAPTSCPPGFYCVGDSEVMKKCKFGTYCEKESSFEQPCPAGTYGSGNPLNHNMDAACNSCGRGLFSTLEKPNECQDCTPGYVCKGRTSSSTPLSEEDNNGYKCPLGHYCPLGSYQELPCPIGTYGKKMGLNSVDQCIKCKVNYYNDEPGQQGCKLCGATSNSDGGSLSCTCRGLGRNFVKSLGACLCSKGYQPLNDEPNNDSGDDCERAVKAVCGTGELITIDGNCLKTADDEKQYCSTQCSPEIGGAVVPGTGMCSCFDINDPAEICDGVCQATKPKVTITKEGKLKVKDPVSGKEGTVDPSTIPGYFGEFKAQASTGASENGALFLDVGEDMSFGYETNADVLAQAGVDEQTDRSQVVQKLFSFTSPWELRDNPSFGVLGARRLQDDEVAAVPKRLFNPVLCVQEGAAIFFNVNAEKKQYPVYKKDAILNTNPDFDYGPFEQLEDMIVRQNITVTTYSHIFRETGIFTFENSQSKTLTVISVVGAGQTCTNSVNGVGAAMVTKEALAEIGIKSYDKQIVPNWYFIIGSVVLINTLLYAIIGLFIWGYNLAQNQGRQSGKKQSKNTLYYDKLQEHDDERRQGLFWCCKKKENKVDREVGPEKKHDFAVSYKDMEALLEEFHKCQAILKQQLKDREKAKRKQQKMEGGSDQEDQQIEPIVSLIEELNEMVKFVNENNDVVNKVLEQELNEAAGVSIEAETKTVEEPDALKNMSKLKREVTVLFDKQAKKEDDYSKKLLAEIEVKQEQAFHRELDKNDQLKDQILGSFQSRLQNGNLTADEQAAMMADLGAKMAQVNDALENEQDAQNRALQEALSRRRAKHDKLRNIMEGISDKKDTEDEHYQKKLQDIQRAEDGEKEKIEKEIVEERALGLETIEEEGKKIRDDRLKAAEKKLNDFKKKGMAGDNEYEFADMLANYGKLVDDVDREMANWKQTQNSDLEDRLRKRREKRQGEASESKQNLESHLNKETQNQRTRFNDEMSQVQSLLKPVKDEEDRLKMVAGDLAQSDAVKHDTQDAVELDVVVTTDTDGQLRAQESQRDGAAINGILRDLDKENAKKKLEISQAREQMKIKIAKCNDDDGEKQRLLDQLKGFEDNMTEQMRSETEGQDAKLRKALEDRRNRRKKQNGNLAQRKQEKILDDFKNGASSKVNMQLNLQRTQGIANRIQAGFEKDEQVQVSENFLDRKNKQELVDLMQSLFDERAGALRKFICELMKEKQRDLQDLKEEFEPMREVLRQRQANNLISDDDYKSQMERLNKDEHDRRMDIEIEYSDKESEIQEELEKARLEAENEQKKVLKDRQTQEKLIMFNEMMKNMENGDQMKQYLEMQKREAEKELEAFRKRSDREKDKKVADIEVEKERKMQELADRQDRMFNWEDRVKRDEDKIMDQFRKQKEEMMARKLAEQQKEILRDMNKEDVDALLAKHKRQLLQMDEALRREQERQMELMRTNQKNKNGDLAKEKMLRQIKLAEIQKKKAADAARAREQQQQVSDEPLDVIKEIKNDKLELCIEKVGIMSQIIYKAAYSRPIQYKRHIMNQHKLNEFLGRNLLNKDDGDVSESVFSIESMAINPAKRVTYSELLERIAAAEKNYETARVNQLAGTRNDNLSQSDYKPLATSASGQF